MADRRNLGGWLQGPGATLDDADGASAAAGGAQDQAYPGQRLGRPQSGSGSIAPWGRRLIAIFVDWALATLIAQGVMRPLHWGGLAPLMALLMMNLLLVGTAGFTVGHRLLGMRVERLEGGLPGPVRGLIRSVLLCLAVPPLVWDRDQRGLHDKAAGTLVVRR